MHRYVAQSWMSCADLVPGIPSLMRPWALAYTLLMLPATSSWLFAKKSGDLIAAPNRIHTLPWSSEVLPDHRASLQQALADLNTYEKSDTCHKQAIRQLQTKCSELDVNENDKAACKCSATHHPPNY